MNKFTQEQIANLTEYIVGGMSYNEVLQHVYDDVYDLMSRDSEMVELNLEDLDMTADQFTDENFRGISKESS